MVNASRELAGLGGRANTRSISQIRNIWTSKFRSVKHEFFRGIGEEALRTAASVRVS